MLFLLIGAINFVVAEEDSEVDIPEPGRVGFFENSFDRVKAAFMFNKERKIEFALERAEKRLAEMEALAETDPERAERAQERYDAFIAQAEEILANIEAHKGDNMDRSKDDLGQIARIQNRFERHREHADEIYTRALERFEMNNASDEKIERFEMFYERSLDRNQQMEEKIIERRENAIKRHKALAELSDEELETILGEIEEKEGLVQAREKRMERAEVRVQKFAEHKKIIAERHKARLENSNLTNAEKAQIQQKIDASQKKVDNIKVRAGIVMQLPAKVAKN